MEMGVPGTKEYYDKWSVQFPGRKGSETCETISCYVKSRFKRLFAA